MGKSDKIAKIEYEGETYYFENGVLYDEGWTDVPLAIAHKVTDYYFNSISYEDMGEGAFLTFVKNLKKSNKFAKCLQVIEFGLNKFTASTYFYTSVFPIITSCYRNLGKPQKAIDFWMENKSLFSNQLSVPLLTSLAAAYCDVSNYDMARYCVDKAYAMQGGSINYQTELSLVYARIKSETEGRKRFKKD